MDCCCSVAKLYPPLCNPGDRCSPPTSTIQGVFLARTLEWGAISFFSTYGYIHIYVQRYTDIWKKSPWHLRLDLVLSTRNRLALNLYGFHNTWTLRSPTEHKEFHRMSPSNKTTLWPLWIKRKNKPTMNSCCTKASQEYWPSIPYPS